MKKFALVVGLTGGIGSGKTTVAQFFARLGIPVYLADNQAKALMTRSKIIKRKLIKLLGAQTYQNEELNKSYIADKIFNNAKLLETMNSIVHPKVAAHFKTWLKKQDSPYIIKEAALLFENGSYKNLDYIITVVAPQELKIQRVIKRDQSSDKHVKAIMEQQWNDDLKVKLSDFIINNIELSSIKQQVEEIHKEILAKG